MSHVTFAIDGGRSKPPPSRTSTTSRAQASPPPTGALMRAQASPPPTATLLQSDVHQVRSRSVGPEEDSIESLQEKVKILENEKIVLNEKFKKFGEVFNRVAQEKYSKYITQIVEKNNEARDRFLMRLGRRANEVTNMLAFNVWKGQVQLRKRTRVLVLDRTRKLRLAFFFSRWRDFVLVNDDERKVARIEELENIVNFEEEEEEKSEGKAGESEGEEAESKTVEKVEGEVGEGEEKKESENSDDEGKKGEAEVVPSPASGEGENGGGAGLAQSAEDEKNAEERVPAVPSPSDGEKTEEEKKEGGEGEKEMDTAKDKATEEVEEVAAAGGVTLKELQELKAANEKLKRQLMKERAHKKQVESEMEKLKEKYDQVKAEQEKEVEAIAEAAKNVEARPEVGEGEAVAEAKVETEVEAEAEAEAGVVTATGEEEAGVPASDGVDRVEGEAETTSIEEVDREAVEAEKEEVERKDEGKPSEVEVGGAADGSRPSSVAEVVATTPGPRSPSPSAPSSLPLPAPAGSSEGKGMDPALLRPLLEVVSSLRSAISSLKDEARADVKRAHEHAVVRVEAAKQRALGLLQSKGGQLSQTFAMDRTIVSLKEKLSKEMFLHAKTKHEMDIVEQRLERIEGELEAEKEKSKKLLADLKSTEVQLNETQGSLKEEEDKVAASTAEIEKKEKEISRLESIIEQSRKDERSLKSTIDALQRRVEAESDKKKISILESQLLELAQAARDSVARKDALVEQLSRAVSDEMQRSANIVRTVMHESGSKNLNSIGKKALKAMSSLYTTVSGIESFREISAAITDALREEMALSLVEMKQMEVVLEGLDSYKTKALRNLHTDLTEALHQQGEKLKTKKGQAWVEAGETPTGEGSASGEGSDEDRVEEELSVEERSAEAESLKERLLTFITRFPTEKRSLIRDLSEKIVDVDTVQEDRAVVVETAVRKLRGDIPPPQPVSVFGIELSTPAFTNLGDTSGRPTSSQRSLTPRGGSMTARPWLEYGDSMRVSSAGEMSKTVPSLPPLESPRVMDAEQVKRMSNTARLNGILRSDPPPMAASVGFLNPVPPSRAPSLKKPRRVLRV
eukprot:CAMPEP_0113912346 /NCGR_PEP_ID=MMETSP0780_2-20120614/28876_1 /TAXON_ID=652834 /ORGANISM="Palpitomonas bilix" /LENGTH=1081 /DNA_ID=CAMNT_0000909295 /DNA_START=182 /DNA_END=3427 /DNA_ORIENTATION=+ /assembly_acc=CAM_ASM_000599